MRFLVTFALIVMSVALLAWGVQLGRYDNNICSMGPCLGPIRLGLGVGAAFAAWTAWHHLPAPGAFRVTPRVWSALIRIGAVVIGIAVAFAGALLGMVQGEMVMGDFRANPWYVSGGIVLGFLAGRWMWRRAGAANYE